MEKRNSLMKKVLNKILHIVVDVLIIAILIISVFILTVALTARNSEGVPNVFGKAPIGVLTDSMKGDKPDDFNKGDMLICDVVGDKVSAEYKVGDVVTFAADIDGNGERDYITHRLYKIKKEKNTNTEVFLTKGDNNNTYDQDPKNAIVLPDLQKLDILAVYHGTKIDGLGGVLNYLQTPNGFFLWILLPMIIFFLYQAVRVVINAMAYSKEKGMMKAQEAMDKAGLTEEQKQKAIAEYLAAQNGEIPAEAAEKSEPEVAVEVEKQPEPEVSDKTDDSDNTGDV
jgi:signal peptidase